MLLWRYRRALNREERVYERSVGEECRRGVYERSVGEECRRGV
jgi:hypothetical protein